MQCNNALKVATFFSEQHYIQDVYYPGLKTHPQHKLAQEIMGEHYGAIISFRVEDNIHKVDAFIKRLEIIKYLGTLGGIRTSLAHPATAFKNEFTQDELNKMGLFDGLIRISIGIEDADDLIKDLSQALDIFK